MRGTCCTTINPKRWPFTWLHISRDRKPLPREKIEPSDKAPAIGCRAFLPYFTPRFAGFHMDIELINALGTQIADLTQRTAELRRYL